MKTVELTLNVPDDLHEYLIAELADLDFEAFQQEDARLMAYLPAPRWNDVAREHIEQWLARHGLPAVFGERVIEPENWNSRWEETIRPVAIGPFLVKPTWATRPAGREELILLEIDPKMSFGTGYHESTRLMLRFLPDVVEGGERLLDAGTGTGILAIAALKLGASDAVAFDLDLWSVQNAVENFYLNGVAEKVDFRAGSIGEVPESGFDLILANINLNVLLGMMPAFAEKVRPGGRVVLAGLLRGDRPRIVETAAGEGLSLVREETENDWWACVLRRDA